MTAQEIRELSSEEIVEKIKTGKAELLNMRMQNAKGALEKPAQMGLLKKEIARMMTILKEREVEASLGGTK